MAKVKIKLQSHYHCTTAFFPFLNLNKQNFQAFISDNISETRNLNSCLILKPPPDLALLFNQFNSVILENHSDLENTMQSKYHGIGGLQQLKIPSKKKYLFFVQILVMKIY